MVHLSLCCSTVTLFYTYFFGVISQVARVLQPGDADVPVLEGRDCDGRALPGLLPRVDAAMSTGNCALRI